MSRKPYGYEAGFIFKLAKMLPLHSFNQQPLTERHHSTMLPTAYSFNPELFDHYSQFTTVNKVRLRSLA